MHPEIARTLVAQRQGELVRSASSRPRAGRRLFPRWHISWTRAVLAPAGAPGPAGADHAGQAHPPGRPGPPASRFNGRRSQ